MSTSLAEAFRAAREQAREDGRHVPGYVAGGMREANNKLRIEREAQREERIGRQFRRHFGIDRPREMRECEQQ